MPLTHPQVATNTIRFGGQKGAPRISYDVELPGAYTFERIVPIDLSGLDKIWTENAKSAGRPLSEVAGVGLGTSGTVNVLDKSKLATYLGGILSRMPSWQPPIPQPTPDDLNPGLTLLRFNVRTPDRLVPLRGQAGGIDDATASIVQTNGGVTAFTRAGLEMSLVQAAGSGTERWLPLPVPSMGNAMSIHPFSIPATTPMIWLIERYTVSTYLSDFGLGRVVNCTTLLPGEELFLSIESWREDEELMGNASSIFDSFQQSAQNRFADALEEQVSQETTSAAAGVHVFSKKEHEGGGFLGFYAKDVWSTSGGESSYRMSAAAFSNSVSSALSEHAAQSNAARETTVTTSDVSREASGSRTLSERRIRNNNLRRTLSFVFRELNQKHTAYATLTDIEVAFGNGQPGSYDRRSLLELPVILEKSVLPNRLDAVLERILNTALLYADSTDTYRSPLEVADKRQSPLQWVAPSIVNGKIDMTLIPAASLAVRFNPIITDTRTNSAVAVPAAGITVSEVSVVLRTDSVVAEALLGEADALDPYALSLQEEDIKSRVLHNRKLEIALETIEAIADPAAKAAAFEQMFNERTADRPNPPS